MPSSYTPSGSVLTGDSLWVDAVNGNDSTAARGNAIKPFLTLTAAQTAAQSGDTIFVRPGAYTSHGLGKNGVNWVMPPGVSVSYIGDNDLFTDAGGAMTFSIDGEAAFSVTGEGACINVIQSGSSISVRCKSLTQSGGTATHSSATWQNGGALIVIAETISGRNSALYWQNGEMHVTANTITSPLQTIYSNGVAANQNGYVTADLIYSSANEGDGGFCVGADGDATAALWVNAKRIVASGECAIFQTGAKLYVQCEKIECGISSDDNGAITITAGKAYITTQKLEILVGQTAQTGMALLTGGTSLIQIGEALVTGNTVDGIQVFSGTHTVSIASLTPTGNGVVISGGTLRLTGSVVNTSANSSSNPASKSGGTLILSGCTMVAQSGRDSITAGTSQNVVAMSSWTNKAANGNVTITTTGGLTVNTNVV